MKLSLTRLNSVVICVNVARTQNGHIRNDTRDVSRRISSPWGAETRSSCGGQLVLVDEAAEQVATTHLKSVRRRLR
jgi:hypothetical protein